MDRSSNGCWTCRIRHRKCDEALPSCRGCSDRTIPCHGYGQKPKWVDDKPLLRAELARIKRIVNKNFRRTRKQQQAELSNNRHPGSPSEEMSAHDAAQSCHTADQGGSSAITGSSPEVAFREAQLLVHYLDYIFPLQYPYYTDEPALGGRGWLFWLLMKRGPLHQAVLTLSALHHHTEFAHTSANRESELIEYHTNALQRLRQVISECEVDRFAENREQLIEFLACGAALISFEVGSPPRICHRGADGLCSCSEEARRTGSRIFLRSSPSSIGCLLTPWLVETQTWTSRCSMASTWRCGSSSQRSSGSMCWHPRQRPQRQKRNTGSGST